MFDSSKKDGMRELYDVVNDPLETKDVSSKHPDVIKEYIGFFEKKFNLKIPVDYKFEPDDRQVPTAKWLFKK